MQDDPQAVADKSDADSTNRKEDDGAQDIDALLNEWGADPAGQKEQPKVQAGDIQTVVDFAKQQMVKDQTERYNSVLDDIAKTVKGDTDFNDDMVVGWASRQVDKDPSLKIVWDRWWSGDDTAGQAFKRELGKRFRDTFADKADKNAREDHEAVVSAVRASSTKAPEPVGEPDWGNMSDSEFEAKKRAYFRSLKK